MDGRAGPDMNREAYLWEADKCVEYLELLKQSTAEDLEQFVKAIDQSTQFGGGFSGGSTPIDVALSASRDRCTTLEAQYRSAVEKLQTVERQLNAAVLDTFKLKQKLHYHSEHRHLSGLSSSSSSQPDGDVVDAVAGLPPNATQEEQIKLLKESLANLSVENQILKANLEEAQAKADATQAPGSGTAAPEAPLPTRSLSASPLPMQGKAPRVVSIKFSETSPSVRGAAEKISLEGYLLKRGGKTDRKWQKRYCILEMRPDANMYVINYRAKEKDNTEKGHIPLPWCTVQETVDAKIDHCFMICPSITQSKMKNFYLAAQTAEAMHEWVFAIEMAARVTPTAEAVLKLGYIKIDNKRKEVAKRAWPNTRSSGKSD